MNTLKVSGPDAEKFLQGQVTCNVNTLLEKKSQLCALCNRKGRVIASFNIIKEKD
jgi:folate-binding Fe-S cluster repair protein YgfZ